MKFNTFLYFLVPGAHAVPFGKNGDLSSNVWLRQASDCIVELVIVGPNKVAVSKYSIHSMNITICHHVLNHDISQNRSTEYWTWP